MAQTVPIDAYLGANRTGLAIGATLYQLDGTTVHAAFSTSGWYEAPTGSGAWHHPGVSLPDAGGVVAVGVSGTEYMRVAVEARQLLYSEYTTPDNTTIGTINTKLGTPASSVSADIAGVRSDTNDIKTRIPAALVGGRIDANVGAISSDATAADNAEAFFDGTGYAGTNNVIPTVTTVTNAVSANVTQISGDSTAADKLEAALDGTGGVTITAALTGNVTGNLSGSVGSVTAGVSLADGAITAAKIADGAIDAATFATGAITASAIAADAITDAKVASDVTIAAVTGAVGSVTSGVTVTTNNDKTGYSLADGAITSVKFGAGAITAAVIATDAIDADALAASAVTEIQSGLATPTNITAGTITTVTNLTNAPTNGDLTATMKASVTTAATAATPTVTAGTVSDKTGYSLSSAGIQAIWGALTSALTTAGSIGKLFVDNINATISSRSSHTAANVRTEMDSNSTQLAKLGTPAGASVSADVAAIKADTANIGAAGAGLTSVASAANLATLTAYVDTEVAAIKAKTDNLPADPADASDIAASLTTITGYIDTEVAQILAAVDTEIAAIKAKTDNLPATPASTSDIPGTAAIASAVFAVAVETGHDLTTVLRAIYAAIRGRSVANSPYDPTTVTYYAPDNTTARVTHTLTDTERTVA